MTCLVGIGGGVGLVVCVCLGVYYRVSEDPCAGAHGRVIGDMGCNSSG